MTQYAAARLRRADDLGWQVRLAAALAELGGFLLHAVSGWIMQRR